MFNFGILYFISDVGFASSAYLEVGAFKKQAQALQVQNDLSKLNGYSMAVKPIKKKSLTSYVLIVEGFGTRKEAAKFKDKLVNMGYLVHLKNISKKQDLFKMLPDPAVTQARSMMAHQNIIAAKKDPEILLTHNLEVATSPNITSKKEYALSLKEAILLSLRYSPELISEQLNRITARYQLRLNENEFELQYAMTGGSHFSWSKNLGIRQPFQNSWDLTPRISRKSSWGGTTSVTMNNSYNGKDYSPQVVLNLDQPLLRGAGPTVVETSLKNRIDQETINKLALKNSYINKVTSVISAYRALIQQKNTYETQIRSLKDARYTLWVNKKRIEAGELEPSGNIQQEYQVSNLALTLAGQKNQFQQSKRALLQLIGLDPTLNIKVPNDVSVTKMEVPNLDKTIRYAFANNISYLSALINYKIIKRALVVAKNEQLWALNLTATHSYGSIAALGQDQGFSNITNGRNQASQIGLRLNVPINDLPRRSTLIAAKVSVEQARLALLARKRQLETEVINQVVDIKIRINLYKMNIKQLELAQRSYDIEVKKRQVGISSSLDVTNTQNQLISAQNSLISSKIFYLQSVSSLEQLLGTTLDIWHINMRFI